jgi:hypothetical protein
VKQTVARVFSIVARSVAGVGFHQHGRGTKAQRHAQAAEAERERKGGVPQKTSSGVGFSTCLVKASAITRMSR